jgi:hypothetical protein
LCSTVLRHGFSSIVNSQNPFFEGDGFAFTKRFSSATATASVTSLALTSPA